MPEFKQHVLVCGVVRDDERHCGDKGGRDVKKKFADVLAANDWRNDVYLSSVGCTIQHGLCEMDQASVIIYGVDHQGTLYVVDGDDVETLVSEHIINGTIVSSLLNEKMKVKI